MQKILDTMDVKDKEALVDWMNASYKKLATDIGMEPGKFDVDRKTALTYFKTTTDFWSSAKPALPKVGIPIPALVIAKNFVCNFELRELHTAMKKLELKRDEFDELKDYKSSAV